MSLRLPARLLAPLAAAAALIGIGAPAARAACPGAGDPCPYTDATQSGQRGGGVLRFPQAVAVGPDGSVYVGDQSSHVVQVFGADGSLSSSSRPTARGCATSARPGRAPAS
jgi:tripartite motif-containing protein 71